MTKVGVRIELPSSDFGPDEIIRTKISISSGKTVVIETASVEITSMVSFRSRDKKTNLDREIYKRDIEVFELENLEIESYWVGDVSIRLPEDVPTTVCTSFVDKIDIKSFCTLILHLGHPHNIPIRHKVPIVVSSRSVDLHHPYFRAIEFPTKRSICLRASATKASAQIEMRRMAHQRDEPIFASLIVDLRGCGTFGIIGATMSIRRSIKIPIEANEMEYELFEGPLAGPIKQDTITSLKVETFIPSEAYIPDLKTKWLSIEHSALIIFYCTNGGEVETEIPIMIL